MKHLDFTIDFETVGLTAQAAPMQVACLPWLRDDDRDPFVRDDELKPFVAYVDLRSCVVDGFEFSQDTVQWWSRKSEVAKSAVCAGEAQPVADVLVSLLDYIDNTAERYHLDSLCLWCQGPDVDIAILRHLCAKYDVYLEDIVPHTAFRDCRTVIIEAAVTEAQRRYNVAVATATSILPDGTPYPLETPTVADILADPKKAYDFYDPLPEKYANGSEAHDALYDCRRSSWYTWQALQWLGRA